MFLFCPLSCLFHYFKFFKNINLVLNNNNFDQQTYNYSRDIDIYGPHQLHYKDLLMIWTYKVVKKLYTEIDFFWLTSLTCVDPAKQVPRGKRNTLMLKMKIVFFGVQRKICVLLLFKCIICVLEMRKEESVSSVNPEFSCVESSVQKSSLTLVGLNFF
jgi:hypothetical protein